MNQRNLVNSYMKDVNTAVYELSGCMAYKEFV
jgi:hypothetical protein